MAEANKKWLVSFDTDKIKDYIFATNGLKEIRGASAILRKQDVNRRGYSGVVFNAGGGGAIEINSGEEAEKLKKGLQTKFVRNTRSATITAVDVHPDEVEKGAHFGKKMQKAMVKQHQTIVHFDRLRTISRYFFGVFKPESVLLQVYFFNQFLACFFSYFCKPLFQ